MGKHKVTQTIDSCDVEGYFPEGRKCHLRCPHGNGLQVHFQDNLHRQAPIPTITRSSASARRARCASLLTSFGPQSAKAAPLEFLGTGKGFAVVFCHFQARPPMMARRLAYYRWYASFVQDPDRIWIAHTAAQSLHTVNECIKIHIFRSHVVH